MHTLHLGLTISCLARFRSFDELIEAALAEALHVKALLADDLLSDEGVKLLLLEHVEVGVDVLDGYLVLEGPHSVV